LVDANARAASPSRPKRACADWDEAFDSAKTARKNAESAAAELLAYFQGRATEFRTPVDLDVEGTAFQRRVWRHLLEIPYGELVSYGDVAEAVGSRKAVRAVGQAVGANPVPVIVPCHRVVGSDGRLTGFGCGLPVKIQLLELEEVAFGPATGSDASRKILDWNS